MNAELETRRAVLVVVGESAGGVAAAVRAARDGLDTILVSYRDALGGILPSLGAIETHYTGARSPFVEELKQKIISFYRETYGEDSEQYQTCITLDPDNPMITFEPRVCARIIHDIVEAEPQLTVLNRYYPLSVDLAGDRIQAATFETFEGERRLRLEAEVFIDASYEGDLAAVAGVPYRIGRESRRDYDEPHAGKIFTRWVHGRFPIDAAEGRLNIRAKWTTLGLMSGSTGEGDDNIQDYSYRLCLSCDPENRILPEKPEGYDREDFLAIALSKDEIGSKPYALHHRFLSNSIQDMVAQDHIFHGHALPNNKRSWNATNLTGVGKAYPEADWPQRQAITRQHLNHALGIMYFMQNDETMPADMQQMAREWGLAKDEFVENDNIPTHMYIREARRIVGRYTFHENDNCLAPGLARAPIHSDSIAITEFPNDSLPCTTETRPGSLPDGQMFMMESSRPGQVPFRIILPERIRNLMVPLCASVTHVAWGTIRQTPTLIQICEAAACAVALARQQNTLLCDLRIDSLQRRLLEIGSMLTFFNEFDMASQQPWVAAVQYLGTKGFFAAYDARPDDNLTQETAALWAETAALMLEDRAYDTADRARRLPSDLSDRGADAVTAAELADLLTSYASTLSLQQAITAAMTQVGIAGDQALRRAQGCQFIYTLLGQNEAEKNVQQAVQFQGE